MDRLSLCALARWERAAVTARIGGRVAAVAWAGQQAGARVRELERFVRAACATPRVQPLLTELAAAAQVFNAAPPTAVDALSAHGAGLDRAAADLVVRGLTLIGPGIAGEAAPRDNIIAPVLSTLAFTRVLAGCAASVARGDAEGGPIAAAVDVRLLIDGAVSRVCALLVDKCGIAPPITVRVVNGDSDSGAVTAAAAVVAASAADGGAAAPLTAWTCVPSYVSFVLFEVLKNAAHAHLTRYTPLGVDDAPPVFLAARVGSRSVEFIVVDAGGGFPVDGRSYPQPGSSFSFGAGAASRRSDGESEEPTYAYSRSFGAPLSGAGAGLPRAAIYAALHGGSLALAPRSDSNAGVEVRLVLPRQPEEPAETLLAAD